MIKTCKTKKKYKGPTRDSPMSDSVRIKGSLFIDLPKPYQKPSGEKRSWQGHPKDLVQTRGQAQDRTRATRGHLKDKKDKQGHMKTILGQT